MFEPIGETRLSSELGRERRALAWSKGEADSFDLGCSDEGAVVGVHLQETASTIQSRPDATNTLSLSIGSS